MLLIIKCRTPHKNAKQGEDRNQRLLSSLVAIIGKGKSVERKPCEVELGENLGRLAVAKILLVNLQMVCLSERFAACLASER